MEPEISLEPEAALLRMAEWRSGSKSIYPTASTVGLIWIDRFPSYYFLGFFTLTAMKERFFVIF